MKKNVLLDTGPLVASLNRRDGFHEWAKAQLARIEPPLLTCEAVLAEACFLLRQTAGGNEAILELILRGIVELPFAVDAQTEALIRLMKKYSDVPISLADACLVRMSELYADSAVLTLDTHFKLYRRHGRQTIPVLMPARS
jgi:predicted nucleic acid-binding protein